MSLHRRNGNYRYLGKRALNFLYFVDVISVMGLIAFWTGPELLPDTSVAEFMLKCRGLMIYHCIVCGLLTGLLQKLHTEISVEIKKLQDWIIAIEEKVEEK